MCPVSGELVASTAQSFEPQPQAIVDAPDASAASASARRCRMVRGSSEHTVAAN